MRKLHHISVALLVSIATLVVADEPAKSPDLLEMAIWTQRLGSERFEVRESASRHLEDAGPAAIDSLLDATKVGSLEARTRALDVLRKLAFEDFDGAMEAEQAIQKIADVPGTVIAQQAKQILSSLKGNRTARATKILQRLGASFGWQTVTYDEQRILGGSTIAVSFGNRWRGKIDDFRLLQWVGDYHGIRVRMMGKQFDDECLKAIVRLDNLRSLELNRSSVTNNGIASVGGLNNLRIVTLRYCDQLTNDCLPSLQKLSKSLLSLTIYDRQITKQGFDQIAKQNPSWSTRFGRGGFLGVGGTKNPNGPGCLVTKVTPNHAANIAGIREYDVITSYNGVKVNRFSPPTEQEDYEPEPGEATLMEMIAKNLPGDKVKIAYRSHGRGREIVKEVTLGAWD